ncbi:hypothetical protein DMN91_012632 [Ooceraea biroi]|uniref:Secreted protein n=1 Tax=Ooceraea biroi TaxID=2015173 RepID=A0A3L8D2L2_OOCBI|nr:hypothetical protein DMN91_012632 [Ooceraea biroi]
MRRAPSAVCIRHSCESISLFLCVLLRGTSQPGGRTRTCGATVENIVRAARVKARCERTDTLGEDTSRNRQQRQLGDDSSRARAPFSSTWSDNDTWSRSADVKTRKGNAILRDQ